MKIGKMKLILITLGLLSVTTIPILAYMYITSQKIPAGIMIESPTVEIGVYWDYACTQPVTRIDFGEIIQPNNNLTLRKTLYIKNKGTVSLWLFWNTTLRSATNEITDHWTVVYPFYLPLNETYGYYNIDPNEVWNTEYAIVLAKYLTINTYNWTLTIWGEY